MRKIIFIALFMPMSYMASAQNSTPTINPTATFHTSAGDLVTNDTTGSAPISATFAANPQNVGSYTAHYEWRFINAEDSQEPFLVRYDENTDYTFETTGTFYVKLYATFVQGTDTVAYTDDYWSGATPITVTIPVSKLEVPNAFSPNGDGFNDIFKVKTGYQSLVEFHAYIYNRQGQKLYEWTNPEDGWDGTYKGHNVKDGVYFVYVRAKGADGIKYNIKRDVNLLRGYIEDTTKGQ